MGLWMRIFLKHFSDWRGVHQPRDFKEERTDRVISVEIRSPVNRPGRGPSAGFVGVKRGTHFLNMCSMGADRFMKLIAGHTELLGPIGDVGGHLGIDLLRVVRPFDVFLMGGVRFVSLGGVVVLGHGAPFIGSPS
jgi:hypothetical protein